MVVTNRRVRTARRSDRGHGAPWLLLLALLIPLVAGCSAFRAQAGFGMGLGAEVLIPAAAASQIDLAQRRLVVGDENAGHGGKLCRTVRARRAPRPGA